MPLQSINLFELGKVYQGKSINEHKELWHLAGISTSKSFLEIKGILERLYQDLGIQEKLGIEIQILDEGIYFEVNYTDLLTKIKGDKLFVPLPKYPPVIEDIALIIPDEVKTGDIIEAIKLESPLITEVSLLDQYENTKTFHIVYLDREKNLTGNEVSEIREKILENLEKKFKVKLK